MRDLHVKLLALALLLFAFSLVFYKATMLGLPLFPSEEIEVWSVLNQIEAMAELPEDITQRIALAKTL